MREQGVGRRKSNLLDALLIPPRDHPGFPRATVPQLDLSLGSESRERMTVGTEGCLEDGLIMLQGHAGLGTFSDVPHHQGVVVSGAGDPTPERPKARRQHPSFTSAPLDQSRALSEGRCDPHAVAQRGLVIVFEPERFRESQDGREGVTVLNFRQANRDIQIDDLMSLVLGFCLFDLECLGEPDLVGDGGNDEGDGERGTQGDETGNQGAMAAPAVGAANDTARSTAVV
jgi:hypothetical protein